MGNHQLASLVKMVNQIAANNTHLGDESEEASVVADHLRKFWSRSMKHQISEYELQGGGELCSVAKKAISTL